MVEWEFLLIKCPISQRIFFSLFSWCWYAHKNDLGAGCKDMGIPAVQQRTKKACFSVDSHFTLPWHPKHKGKKRKPSYHYLSFFMKHNFSFINHHFPSEMIGCRNRCNSDRCVEFACICLDSNSVCMIYLTYNLSCLVLIFYHRCVQIP